MDISKEQEKILLKHEVDHEGHAQCTLVLYPGMFKHSMTHGWLQYTGTHWETEGARQAAERAITNTLQKRRELFAGKEAMKKARSCMSYRSNVTGALAQLAKTSQIYVNMADFDKSPDVLNVKNGMLDLKSGKITPHSPAQLFTYCLPIEYNPEIKKWDGWIGFLRSLELSPNVIDYLQLALGYSLTGHTSEEILFYLYGPTRSGKGTFTEVINTMLGNLSTGVDMQTFVGKRYGDTSNFDLAPLKNKRLITASESQRQGQLNPATIKKITGGDEIYCSFKRRDHFSYRPQYKIWITSNFPVNTDVDDDAAWGRIRVIHFHKSFLGQEDKTLKHRLKKTESLQEVFSWAVAGAMDWYKLETVGLPLPQEVADQTEEHRQALDSIGQFIDQQCEIDTITLNSKGQIDEFTVGKQLYGAYKSWCEDEGYMPFGRKRFTASLNNKGVPSDVRWVDGKTARGYLGIRLLTLHEFSNNGTHESVSIFDDGIEF